MMTTDTKPVDYRVPAPMLASPLPEGKTVADFEGNAAFVMEPKIDGVRLTVRILGGKVVGWSRPRAGAPAALQRQIPAHIVAALASLPDDITLDGELALDGGKSFDVLNLANEHKLVYKVFDVLRLLGTDVMSERYFLRRAYLEEIFRMLDLPGVELLPVSPVSKALIDDWMAAGLEGAIIKRVDARYRPGARSESWLKVKALHSAVLTVTGFKAGKLGPYSSIELVDANGQATRVKTLDSAMMAQIEANPTSFIGRKLAIEYTERIAGGAYRHPRADHFVS